MKKLILRDSCYEGIKDTNFYRLESRPVNKELQLKLVKIREKERRAYYSAQNYY